MLVLMADVLTLILHKLESKMGKKKSEFYIQYSTNMYNENLRHNGQKGSTLKKDRAKQ